MSKLTRFKIRFYAIESLKVLLMFFLSLAIGFAIAKFDGWTFQQHPVTLVLVTFGPFSLLTRIFCDDIPSDWQKELDREPYLHPWQYRIGRFFRSLRRRWVHRKEGRQSWI